MTAVNMRGGWAIGLAWGLGCTSSSPAATEEGTGTTGDPSPSSTSAPATDDGDTGVADTTGSVDDDATSESSSTGEEPDPEPFAPLCPDGLPFELTRSDVGTPLSAGELTAATQRYLDLLERTRYFDFVAERAHGWPEDVDGGYWFSTWWSGVSVEKRGGAVTYLHAEGGADNNGLRTGPLVQGACYALAQWGRPADEHLVRALIRGFSAWMIAMERSDDDADGPLLSRAFYPESLAGADYAIDYSLNRPGIDNGATEYVHVPGNPHYGDIWIKNKRSKDDIGHMMRAIAQLGACGEALSGEGAEEWTELSSRYTAWARKVEDDGWRIATLDKDGEVWFPPDLLAYFILDANVECDAVLGLRLLGRGDPGELDCGNGIGRLDPAVIGSNDSNGNILRSFHEAAANNALVTGNDAVAEALLSGMGLRLDEALDGHEGVGDPVPFLGPQDTVDMILHGVASGVPLTSREVAYVHARIDEAKAALDDPMHDPVLATFDPATPDGSYPFAPYSPGVHFRSLGLPLAACASPCVNASTQPLLDCDLVASWSP